ncbi:MAG: helix-turn-helix domain-containing protein [Polyangiaceae bacterium]|jgi:AcrR family transcriptional regulator
MGYTERMGRPERRQQILSVAREVFARRGYHAAKIDEIVAAAGIARGTFYLYFEDKRAIFEEIVDRTIARLGLAIVRVDPHDQAHSVAYQVRDNIRRIVRILLEDRATTKILLSDALGVDPAFDRKLLSFYDEMSSMLETSLRNGQELQVVTACDVRLMSWLTMGALKEAMFQIVQRGAEYDEDKLVDGAFAFFCAGCLRV